MNGLAGSSRSDIISVLKSEIADFEAKTQVNETGRIISINDGIVNIYGLNHAMYGELVEFETGVKGIVQNVERKTLGCVLLGSDHGLTEGSKVVRTKKRAGVGVGEKLLGRVVDALGAPIDGMGEIEYDDYYPIEREAAGVCNRKSVTVPLETGILSIDSMFPIGRGQRELIIGDRQTGKTSIALDTILNQKGKDMICVYVAIGQKASTVAKFVEDLKKHVKDWEDEDALEDYLEKLLDKQAFDKKGLIYGMGHAVYTISDPRQQILHGAVKKLAFAEGHNDEFDLYERVERLAPKVIGRKRKIYKGVAANVDFYSGLLYSLLDIPCELYTPLFATARITGWSAHRLEELINCGKIIRPAYMSISENKEYVDLKDR